MNNKINMEKENIRILQWFKTHKNQIELLQKLQPSSPAIQLLTKILKYHSETNRWPLLLPRSATLLKNAFGSVPPLEIQKG